MRQQNCNRCGSVFSLNEMVSVFDEVMCRDCTDKRLKDVPKNQITPQAVYAMHDPTVCARCGADNGLEPYDLFLEAPFCSTCRDLMKHYPFPLWIKAACVVIALMVGFTVYMNLRFFKARILLARSTQLGFNEALWEQASQGMEQAARLVPESSGLKILWHYMAGIHELQQKHYDKASEHLSQCNELPAEYYVESLLFDAQSGAAFDKKDYSEFLRISQQKLQRFPDDPMVLAQLASAHACIYAADGREEDKQKSLDCLKQAGQVYGESIPQRFAEYKERILHRIQTRQILSKEEYDLQKEKSVEEK